MAVVRWAEGQQRSGSVGGSVYSHNRFGAYIRARSVPVNPNTDLQVAARNRVRELSIAWQTDLTDFQRSQWKTYAQNVPWQNALGDDVRLTGLNHYIRSNTAVLQAGLPRVDDGPNIYLLFPAEDELAVVASEAAQTLSVTFSATRLWANTDDAAQLVYMGRAQNSGIAFFGGPYRLSGIILGDGAIPPVSPMVLPAPFPFATDNRIWVRTRIVFADGRLSEFAQVNFLGVA